MNLLVLDFETYFDAAYSLRKLTIPQYVHDPRFCVHGLAILHPDARVEFRADVREALGELQAAYGPELERVTVVCHHAHFDLYILNHKFGVRPKHFADTLCLARQVLGPHGVEASADPDDDQASSRGLSLAALARWFGLEAKGDTAQFSRVRELDFRQQADMMAYALKDVRITRALAEQLLAQVSRPEVELPLIQHTVRLFTERSIAVDHAALAQLRGEITGQTEEVVKASGLTPEQVSRDKEFAAQMTAALAASGRKLPTKPGKNGQIPATARNDEAMQALAGDSDPAVARLAQARLALKSTHQSLARLATLEGITKVSGGYLPPYLVYYGAHTGRFSGRGKFNVQNLGRSGQIGRIRHALVPRDGHVFVIGDLAQIEARIVAWFAREENLLDAYRGGRDIYCEFASQTFGTAVRKPASTDSPEDQLRLKALRQVGKQAVLGLGFGMGPLRFMQACRGDSSIRLLFDQNIMNEGVCKEVVQSFRQSYPGIPRFWHDLESAFEAAMSGMETECGPLKLSRQGADVHLELPSGRLLRYPQVRRQNMPRRRTCEDWTGQTVIEDVVEETLAYGRGEAIALYGGKLCENVVQAAARDVLVEAILAIEQAGFPVLFHVHDEVVVEAPKARSQEAVQVVTQALEHTPCWLPGLPVKAEVKALERYGK